MTPTQRSSASRRRRIGMRAAFTLIEVMVAMTLGVGVVLGARMLAESLALETRAAATQARRVDADANAEHWLRNLVRNTDAQEALQGDSASVAFASWCDTPLGWQERCPVRLAVQQTGEAARVRVTTFDNSVVELPWRPAFARLIYLANGASGGAWSQQWSDEISRPVGIGLVLDADTLILRVGRRQ